LEQEIPVLQKACEAIQYELLNFTHKPLDNDNNIDSLHDNNVDSHEDNQTNANNNGDKNLSSFSKMALQDMIQGESERRVLEQEIPVLQKACEAIQNELQNFNRQKIDESGDIIDITLTRISEFTNIIDIIPISSSKPRQYTNTDECIPVCEAWESGTGSPDACRPHEVHEVDVIHVFSSKLRQHMDTDECDLSKGYSLDLSVVTYDDQTYPDSHLDSQFHPDPDYHPDTMDSKRDMLNINKINDNFNVTYDDLTGNDNRNNNDDNQTNVNNNGDNSLSSLEKKSNAPYDDQTGNDNGNNNYDDTIVMKVVEVISLTNNENIDKCIKNNLQMNDSSGNIEDIRDYEPCTQERPVFVDCDIDLTNEGNIHAPSNDLFYSNTNDNNGDKGIATIGHENGDGDGDEKSTIDHQKITEKNIGTIKIDHSDCNDALSLLPPKSPASTNQVEDETFVDLSQPLSLQSKQPSSHITMQPSSQPNSQPSLQPSNICLPGCLDKNNDALEALVSILISPTTTPMKSRSNGDMNADVHDVIYTLPRTSVKEIFRDTNSLTNNENIDKCIKNNLQMNDSSGNSEAHRDDEPYTQEIPVSVDSFKETFREANKNNRFSGYSENKNDNTSQKTLPYYSDDDSDDEESGGLEKEENDMVEIIQTSQ
jgi:hypothetical protein